MTENESQAKRSAGEDAAAALAGQAEEKETERAEGAHVDAPSAPASTEPPQISLDRYLSRRRAPLRSTGSQMASLFFMLVALILLFVFKNRCGLAVSNFLGQPPGNGSSSAPADRPKAAP